MWHNGSNVRPGMQMGNKRSPWRVDAWARAARCIRAWYRARQARLGLLRYGGTGFPAATAILMAAAAAAAQTPLGQA